MSATPALNGVQKIIRQLNAATHGEACVVIKCLSAMSSVNMLMTVRKQSLNAAFPSVHVFIYCSADPGDFRFGIRRPSVFGQGT